jgi:hypothetical protein
MLLQRREGDEFLPAIRITEDWSLMGMRELMEKASYGFSSHHMDGPGGMVFAPGSDTEGLLRGGFGMEICPECGGTSSFRFALERGGVKKKVAAENQEKGHHGWDNP